MLIKIFLIIDVLLAVFLIVLKKFKNPYTLTFIFGKKGSGKSCFMVNSMIKHLKKGWLVYSDMDVNIPGVRIISALDLEHYVPEPHSVFYLDEAGLLYDNRKFKNFADGVNEFYKFQRKYKCKGYMNSQSFDIDLKIRSLVDHMILQTAVGSCISISRPIKRSLTLTEPDGGHESRIADKLSFRFPIFWKFYWMPKYWVYFNSFDAPNRPYIHFKEVPKEFKSIRKCLRMIKKNSKHPKKALIEERAASAPSDSAGAAASDPGDWLKDFIE